MAAVETYCENNTLASALAQYWKSLTACNRVNSENRILYCCFGKCLYYAKI